MATTTLYTAADVERLPEDERFELIRGERRDVSPTTGQHARIQTRLARFMDAYADERKLGAVYTEGGFLISQNPDTLQAPDVAFVQIGRILIEEEDAGFMPLVPDLAVEILSPGDRTSETLEKVRAYLDAGVLAVWVIDPKRQRVTIWKSDLTVQELQTGETLDGGEVLPGFQVPVADLFPR